MIVLDTHVWIWWLVAPRRLSKSAKAVIERSDRIGVSVFSVFEVGDLESRG